MPEEQVPATENDGTRAISSGSATHTSSLYRRYRPTSFDPAEFVGQEPIVRTLRNAVITNRVSHAYLFCGPRGTGKTTMARILAKAANCLGDPESRPCNACVACLSVDSGTATDVIEIDAASNRGIDDIRDLRDRVRYAPADLRTKFYIIDEAHQITGAAANAFLKTLEEPPPHARFVLATTDPDELLPTIVSRCQRYDFRRIELSAMMRRLRHVADAEDIAIDESGLTEIALNATGSLRDALGLLDLVAAYGHSVDDIEPIANDTTVKRLLGLSHNEVVDQIVQSIVKGEPGPALSTLIKALEAGVDARHVNRQLVARLRQFLHTVANPSEATDEMLIALSPAISLSNLIRIAAVFNETEFRIRHTISPQLPLEIAIVEAALLQSEGSPAIVRTETISASTPEGIPPISDTVGNSSSSNSRRLRDAVQQDRTNSSPADGQFDPAPQPPSIQPVALDGQLSIDQLRDLWPRIRENVKSRNRRIEALLTSTDPVTVSATSITLVAEFPFHRDKLNADEPRLLIQEVIAAITGTRYSISAILRDELSSSPGHRRSGISSAQPAVTNPVNEKDAADQRVIQAAENLFGAMEDL